MKQLGIGIFFIMLLAACGRSSLEVDPSFAESPTAVRGVLATAEKKLATPIPIMVTVTQRAEEPTIAPAATIHTPTPKQVEATVSDPRLNFSELRFMLTPEGRAQHTFPTGTDEVYALWAYSGMSAEDKIRRIWFRDDQIWLTREEGWNWGEYGNEGTMRDISVYDDEGSGLLPATYRLQLYVNDALQQEASFIISSP